jgi:hypothetical protein
MAKTTFDTNPVLLQTLLKTCEDGKLQLPDFQRSWVWEEEAHHESHRLCLAGFSDGALMSLKSEDRHGCGLRLPPHRGRSGGGADQNLNNCCSMASSE